MHKEILDPLVKKITDDSVRPSITVSVRDIIEKVRLVTGHAPNPSEVWYSMQRLGIVPKGKNGRNGWAWRHNEPS